MKNPKWLEYAFFIFQLSGIIALFQKTEILKSENPEYNASGLSYIVMTLTGNLIFINSIRYKHMILLNISNVIIINMGVIH